MRREFNIIIEHGEKYFIGYCPEVPGANGQGETIAASKENVLDAISLLKEDAV